jgi:hydrogenase expression/formation protein HypE
MTNDENPNIQGAYCPVPLAHDEIIVVGHGSGGRMTHDLVRNIFYPGLANPILQTGNDSGVITIACEKDSSSIRLAYTTDAHVVYPLFFAGGDIGRLAVCGTVNDLAMMGADPLYLTAGFILEEGLSLDTLKVVVSSMQAAAQEAGILIAAGDTKVVQKGKADGLFITTSGVGSIPASVDIHGANARPGDVVILSGTIGDHGIAVLNARGELGLETQITSDVAPLNDLVKVMLRTSSNIHVLRDPTRGGLATTINEIARQSNVGVVLREQHIPIAPPVRATCEILGFDPLYVANEGKLIAIAAPEDAPSILKSMQQHRYGRFAAIIGEITKENPGMVLMKTELGSTRIVDMLAGEMLPRIC